MSTIRRLRFVNFHRFKGEHILELEPKAYAVVARHEKDPDRSNYLGKTSLVEVVRLALYGEHRHRLEDGWITRGEDEGSVEVTFDNGLMVERSRRRGKSTILRANDRATSAAAKGEEAQKLVHQHLGLTLRDFEASCYFEQRATARMVLAKPADRMKIVEAWLELDPVKAAEAHNGVRLERAVVACELVAARLAQQPPPVDPAVLEAAVQEAGRRYDEVVKAHVLAKDNARLVRAAQGRRSLEGEAKRTRERGKALAAEVATLDDEAVDKAGAARELVKKHDVALSDATRVEREKRELAAGEFDGTCPLAGIRCPAKDQINDRRVLNAAAHVEAESLRKTAQLRSDQAASKAQELVNRAADWRDKTQELERLRKHDVMLQESLDAFVDIPELDAEQVERELSRAATQEGAAAQQLQAAKSARLAAKSAVEERARLERSAQDAEAKLAPLREAAVILGRNGVQRRLAEPFLQGIEQQSNAALAQAGIDLRVKVLWEHESDDVAKACGVCGYPFPSSTKVKQCGHCGGARGRHIVNRLDFEFSDRSAAAEDLWGIAMQLAAARYLRERRGAQLETAFLDEPMSAMDRAHRRAMSNAFATMLGSFGFRQSLIIGHHSEGMNLGGTIQIEGKSDGTSTIRVV